MLTLTWTNRNRIEQADMPVPYDAADTGREDGQQTVVEWRYRADPGDPWGDPTIQIITTPATASYTAPGAGWVQVSCYSTRDSITSFQQHVGVFEVDGSGEPVVPNNLITEGGDRLVTEAGDPIMTE